MKKSQFISGRLREVFLNGRWIANTNYKETLDSVTLFQATQKVGNLNTIAMLTFHINYYLDGVLTVLKGGELSIRDQYSFDLPPLKTEEDWLKLKQELYDNAEQFATYTEALTDEVMGHAFVDEKYGTYERNLEAMIEHSYYHLGQISLLKKMLA
ncbi:MAG TPA: DinB family protein [Bacteroidia bacterium]